MVKKPLGKEEKYMEIHKSTISRTEEKTSLLFKIGEENLEIELTEDKPNDVKNVFNKLITQLKDGLFNFELEDDKEDLYYHICSEYIQQLNTELQGIYEELSDYELLNKTE